MDSGDTLDDSTPAEAMRLFACTPLGVLGATLTIILTSVVDSIWLVPFVAKAPTKKIAIQHGSIYLISFVSLTSTVSLVTYFLREGLSNSSSSSKQEILNGEGDVIWSVIGAVLCWTLAALLYYKAWLKKNKRNQQDESAAELLATSELDAASSLVEQDEAEEQVNGGSRGLLLEMMAKRNKDGESGGGTDYANIMMVDEIAIGQDGEGSSSPMTTAEEEISEQGAQPCMVVSLTVAGSLDEVSYYPALILGNVFSVSELIIGTMCSSLTMLLVVTVFLAQCQPALALIDRIPLYAVVTLFAILMTSELVMDLLS